jgi:hypothetical protein
MALQLTHLVAAGKLTEDYVLRLQEAITVSSVLLHQLRPETRTDRPARRMGLLAWIMFWRKWQQAGRFGRKEMRVMRRAERRAWQVAHEMGLD